MTDLDEAVFRLLTSSPEPADVIIADLRAWQRNGIYKGPQFQPGDVLSALDRLMWDGRVSLVPGDGYRRKPPEPSGRAKQGSMFG